MRILSLAACVLVLAACSSGGYESARDVAAALPCVSVESDDVMIATESVSCELDGGSVRVSWFESGDDLDEFKTVADTMGEAMGEWSEAGSDVVYGDDWAVECDTDDLCDLVRDRL